MKLKKTAESMVDTVIFILHKLVKSSKKYDGYCYSSRFDKIKPPTRPQTSPIKTPREIPAPMLSRAESAAYPISAQNNKPAIINVGRNTSDEM
ncbi:hypothetical protein ACFL6H_06145 [Candidatus Latescibacterota bacterium]